MDKIRVKVGMASCGVAAGARDVYLKLEDHIRQHSLPVELSKTACLGMCFIEPLVELTGSDLGKVTLGQVDQENICGLLDEYLANKVPSSNIVQAEKLDAPYNGLLAKQKRIVLQNCGVIDPLSIDDYEARGGYQALKKALTLPPGEIIAEVKDSGLRGRGGAGFSTGLKWSFAAAAKSPKKYVVCDADEGDPGAFMDRSVLEGDPHKILEGMIIGAMPWARMRVTSIAGLNIPWLSRILRWQSRQRRRGTTLARTYWARTSHLS